MTVPALQEYNDRVAVQRGTATFDGGVTSINVTIAAVNLGKSYLIFSHDCHDSTNTPDEIEVRGRLTSTTNIEFLVGSAPGTGFYIDWQVVEWETVKSTLS